MKTKFLLLSALAALTLAACQKDNDGLLRLYIEGMGSDSKMAAEGGASYWATGDKVDINGTEYTIDVDESSNTATVDATGATDYYGVYPSSIIDSRNGANYVLNLPSTYTYATTTHYGRTLQNVAAPMVGYAEYDENSSTSMQFKHVTAALNVKVTNYHYDYAIVVDTIMVLSGNYRLCGPTSVTINENFSLNATAFAEGDVDSIKCVTMLFNGGSTLQVAASSSANVQIPVLPVGAGNKFTVKISVHRADDATIKATLVRTQTTGGALSRAQIGYVPYNFGGPFSVSDSKKVIISSGNLQYKASDNIWRFAPSQFDCIRSGNSNIADDYDGWIDLFGWGTRDNPTLHTTNSADYSTFKDWGSNIGAGWRTLTNTESSYLFNTRTTVTSGMTGTDNGTARYVKAFINVIKDSGVVVFPDNFIMPLGVTVTTESGTIMYNGAYTAFRNFKISESDWRKMELAGAVFLPLTGRRLGTSVTNTDMGYYWSSKKTTGTAGYCLAFQNSGLNPNCTYYASNGTSVFYGHAVRLVRDVE